MMRSRAFAFFVGIVTGLVLAAAIVQATALVMEVLL